MRRRIEAVNNVVGELCERGRITFTQGRYRTGPDMRIMKIFMVRIRRFQTSTAYRCY